MKFRALILQLLLGLGLLIPAQMAMSRALPEFRVKAAFIYNFIAFTEWPDTVGTILNLCIHGENSFGKEIDALQGRQANNRKIVIQKHVEIENLHNCQIVFISNVAANNLPEIIEHINNNPILTLADSEGAAQQGVAINMDIKHDKIIFEANLAAARRNGLNISSKLLHLATKVY